MTNGANKPPVVVRTERGLSISGTRKTLYQVMDYIKADWPSSEIQDIMRLTDDEIQGVMQYIDEHREEVEAEYQQVLRNAEENRRYWEERNRERFRSPDPIRLRHVLLAAPPDDVAGRLQARGRAEALVAELRERPELFADLAARHSQCPSHTEGGELGWLQRGQTTPEFDRQVFRLREGLAGFPVESRWGYHVVEVLAIEAGQAQSFEQARGRIADYLELQARQQDVQGYLARLRERYPVRGLDEIEAQAGQA